MLKNNKQDNTYIHIHGTPALMITPALATPQVLTSDMASSGLLLTCTLGFHVHKHSQLRELEFVISNCLFEEALPLTASILLELRPGVQGHKISSSQFLKDQKY